VIVGTHLFKDDNSFSKSKSYKSLLRGVTASLNKLNNVEDGSKFALRKKSDKKSNGVSELKVPTSEYLVSAGFERESNLGLLYGAQEVWGGVDFIRKNRDGSIDVIEWETGNVSSMSRCLVKIQDAEAAGLNIRSFTIIVPHRNFARHCTGSIVSHETLAGDAAPKHIWSKFDTPHCGLIWYDADIFIEADDDSVEYMEKGLDGRSGQSRIRQAEAAERMKKHLDFVDGMLEY
jgi:hypothetical protein